MVTKRGHRAKGERPDAGVSMNAIERLKRDHALLRAKLDVLESALKMGSETWFVLREVCFTLSRQLRDHIKREEALVIAYRTAVNPKVLAEVSVEHRDEPRHLRTINRLFMQESGRSLERVAPVLTQVIAGLRRHMAEEEAELFPLLERELREHPLGSAQPCARPLDECMTVNRVLHDYPGTQAIFDRLFINIPLEGSNCLDEVAWRHGVESRELLEQLEQVIAAGRAQSANRAEPSLSCACR